jgi:hypothetical protein
VIERVQAGLRRAGEVALTFDAARVLWIAALLLLPLTAWRLGRAATTQDLDPVSEVWTALAGDWHRGEGYRPLFSETGYGGTRYMPAFTVLQSFSMRFLPLPASGFAVTGVALALLLLAAHGILRQMGLGRLAAAGGSCLLLLSLTLQYSAVATRGELLSMALQLSGFWASGVAASAPASRARLGLAAALFGAAVMAKFTGVSAAMAAVVLLFLGGRRAAAAGVTGGAAAAIALLVGLTQLATDGRFLGVMAACAGGRDSAWLRIPHRLATNVLELLMFSVPPCLLAVGMAFDRAAWQRLRPLMVLGACSALVAGVVHSGHSIAVNHLMEVEVACALILAAGVAGGVVQRPMALATVGAVVFALWSLLLARDTDLLRKRAVPARRDQYAEVLPLLEGRKGPLFSTYPLLPLLKGERPVLLDHWMFLVASARAPGMTEDLHRKIRTRTFGALALESDPYDPAGRERVDYWFGPGTADLIRESYEPLYSRKVFFVLGRKSDR